VYVQQVQNVARKLAIFDVFVATDDEKFGSDAHAGSCVNVLNRFEKAGKRVFSV
jgi:hypothetical protein